MSSHSPRHSKVAAHTARAATSLNLRLRTGVSNHPGFCLLPPSLAARFWRQLDQSWAAKKLGDVCILSISMRNGFGSRTRASAGFTVVEILRSEEHTSELQSLMRISYAVLCLK